MTRVITVKCLFGLIQIILSISVVILGLLINYDAFSIQSALELQNNTTGFYVLFFLIFGIVFLAGGLFLIYEWWES